MSTEAPSGITRRTAITAGAAGLAGIGVVAVAGCSGSGSSPSRPGRASSRAKADQQVAQLSNIPVGTAVSAELDGEPIIVARPTADTAAAFSAVCTHMVCTVRPAGKELHCPCHGSKYNAFTGAVINGPAPRPLPKIDVHVANGDVVTG